VAVYDSSSSLKRLIWNNITKRKKINLFVYYVTFYIHRVCKIINDILTVWCKISCFLVIVHKCWDNNPCLNISLSDHHLDVYIQTLFSRHMSLKNIIFLFLPYLMKNSRWWFDVNSTTLCVKRRHELFSLPRRYMSVGGNAFGALIAAKVPLL
jgi:hypothetical protein